MIKSFLDFGWKQVIRYKSTVRIVNVLCMSIGIMGLFLSSCASASTNDAVTLRAIAMVSADEGWAVGESSRTPASVILHYTHNQWAFDQDASKALDPSVTLSDIKMLSADEGWAVGSINIPDPSRSGFRVGGILIHYLHRQWKTDTVIQGTAPLRAVAFHDPQDGWAAGDGGIYHYDGNAWRAVSLSLPQGTASLAFTSISLSGAYAWFGGYGNLYQYDGNRWSRLAIPPEAVVHSLSMNDSSNGTAIFDLSSNESSQTTDIWHLTNGQWTPQVQFPIKELTNFATDSTGDGWAVGVGGKLAKISAGTWQAVSSPTQANLSDVAIISPNEAWVVGSRGTILHYQNGSWESVSIP